MAWTSGTCTGHLALLDALKTFLTANGWACLADRPETIDASLSPAPSSLSHRTLYFKGTGLAGEDEVFIGFQDWQWSGADVFNIALQGFTGFDTELTFWTQPGSMPFDTSSGCNLNLACTSVEIAYWFIANGRRAIIAARISNAYCCAYAGLFLPYCRPNQYPYPLFIGGNSARLKQKYTVSDSGNCNFWWSLANYNSNSFGTPSYDQYSTGGFLNTVWERLYYAPSIGEKRAFLLNTQLYYGGSSTLKISEFFLNNDGTRWLCPVTLAQGNSTWGILDGVFNVTGNTANVEDIISIDDVSYLLLPNVYRTSTGQFAALKLE